MGRQAATASRLALHFRVLHLSSNFWPIFCMTLSHVSPFGKLKVGRGQEVNLVPGIKRSEFPLSSR